ncbi:S26 family signal peptidase, partial [Neisseria gonorrhoeae]
MRRLFDRAMLAMCLTAALLVTGYGLLYAAGFRINDTRSVAKGVYRISGEAVRRGSYITFCPPDTEVFRMARRRGYIRAGFCPENYSGLMKFVAGIPGDNYRFTDEGLLINGRL